MSDKDIKKSKKIRKVTRRAPLFDNAVLEKKDTKDLVILPNSAIDIARLMRDEVLSKYPDTKLPQSLTGKHSKILNMMIDEFGPSAVREMIRILVWDFDVIKSNPKDFYPPCATLNFPWLDQLYHYRYALFSAQGKGLTVSSSRISKYAERYLQKKEEKSLADIARERSQNG